MGSTASAAGAGGATATGGSTGSGAPEQFGPWHGGAGVGASTAADGESGDAISAGLKIGVWFPHPADARSGVKHATATSSRAARPLRSSEVMGENIGARWFRLDG